MLEHARFFPVLVSTLGMIFIVGCGQSSYEQTMVQTEKKVKQAGKFSPLGLFPVPINDTPCQIRLPEPFVTRTGLKFFAAAADGEGGPKVDELQPPCVKLPDLKLAFQSMGSDEKGAQYPYFCYVAALPPGAVFTAPAPKPPVGEPKGEMPAEPTAENKPETPADNKPEGAPAENKPENKPENPFEEKPKAATESKPENPFEEKPAAPAESNPAAAAPAENKPEASPEQPAAEKAPAAQEPVKLADWIKTQLVTAFPDQKDKIEWQPVEAQTPVLNQPPIPWHRISVEGLQPFQFIGGAASDFLEHVEGKFVLYMCERDGNTVLIGWRVPKPLESKAPIDEWALLAAGTLRP